MAAGSAGPPAGGDGSVHVPGNSDLTALLRDIDAKRELVGKLQESLDHHKEAIKKLGEESVEAERVERELDERNAELRKDIDGYTAQSVLTEAQLYEADREVVTVAHATLAQRLAVLQEQNREAMTRIQRLQNELIERNELEIKIEALQSAHQAQSAHLASLRDSLCGASADKRELVRNQRAIAELERIAEAADQRALTGGRDGSGSGSNALVGPVVESPPFALLRQENAALERKLEEARRQVAAVRAAAGSGVGVGAGAGGAAAAAQGLTRHLAELRERHRELSDHNAALRRKHGAAGGVGGVGGGGGSGHPAAGPLSRPGGAGLNPAELEAEADALQEELLEKSREHAARELALEMKILEAKSVAQHGFSSSAAFVLDEGGAPRGVAGLGRELLHEQGRRRGTPPSRLDPIGL